MSPGLLPIGGHVFCVSSLRYTIAVGHSPPFHLLACLLASLIVILYIDTFVHPFLTMLLHCLNLIGHVRGIFMYVC